jgi:tryptophanyl-tRNA synthetase
VDGRKASKSLGNAIALSATPDQVAAAVRAMYTDPGHVRASDPGHVEGNVVFAYLRAFDPDQEAVTGLEAHYQRGGLGDMTVKRRLDDVLQALIAPIRERRAAFAADPGEVLAIVARGTARARAVAAAVLADVRAVFHVEGVLPG